ncbi:MAG TPA: chemotaxis protein CheB [Burkholderiaceae bacterium]|nr:chemotaxis protein CheB [Burkholderiaceae bacterium]
MNDRSVADAEQPEDAAPPPAEFGVVGIGASAGGIAALKTFFDSVPHDSGMAYVVILHLSPDHDSQLAEVLQSGTPMPVIQVRERQRIERDHVYVVPPNRKLTVADGAIDVSEIQGIEERRAPVDMFLRRLAQSHRDRAVGVILSGTGSNGSMGIKRVKELGGLCIAQEPSEAEYADMPRNSIATGLIDFVLPVAQIAPKILSYKRHSMAATPADGAVTEEQALVDIFAQLRVRTGHDFTNYKRSTVMRRIERRRTVHELPSLGAYASYLRDNRSEARALLKDLLISVTSFFRDPQAWVALERDVLPRLFADRGPADHLRVWVAGCATGEEAYSVAMLLSELAPDPISGPALQIFATDIDETALAKARAGLYSLPDVADLSPERLRRFFVKDGEGYRVRREPREMVLFASHNLIKDPPFLHLDLITCRNLLIYLNRPAQERVLKVFHFGLNPNGYLFLGTSESVEEAGDLYLPVDKEHHVFQSRVLDTRPLPPVAGSPVPPPRIPIDDPTASPLRERLSYQELHLRLLERYAPPSALVDEEYDVLHLSESVGRYLHVAGGEPSNNLLKLVRPELRLDLHSTLSQAVQRRASTRSAGISLQIDGKPERVNLVARPVFREHDSGRGLLVVLFEPADSEPPPATPVASAPAGVEPIARQLEDELMRIRSQLRATVEQHTLQQEELRASNEELQAMNEELRSSSEELETSKEELQSVNEELTTVNQELKIKIDELSQANNDLRNLMNSTDIATVFVDRGLNVKLFTPRARALFNLIPADAGRPLLHITHRLRYAEMLDDIEQVLDTLGTLEREVQSIDGATYIARALPYRTAEDQIAGVVLTFTDITERKRAEHALGANQERMRLVVDSVRGYAIITFDTDGVIQTWNEGARELFGYSEQEAIGQHSALIFTPEDRARGAPALEMAQARTEGRAIDERWHLRKDGTRCYISGVMAPLVSGGTLLGYTKVARDLTQRQRSEEELRQSREELEARVRERTRELAQANEALRREIAERRQSEAVRVGLLRQLVTAQENERRRISRELHDQLGQQVTALGLKISALKSASLPPPAQEQVDTLTRIVAQLDSDLEFLVWELRPTALDDLGLQDALSDYVASWGRYFEVPAQFHVRGMGSAKRLPQETETVLYRIAQEALNNVAKHAHAKSAELILERRGAEVLLIVADDGDGFDPQHLPSGKGLGLISMRERAALVGGSIEIESARGRGTTLYVRLPAADSTL